MPNDWTLTRDKIIASSLRLIGVLSPSDTLSDVIDNVSEARDTLLSLMQSMENKHDFPFRIKRLQHPLSQASDEVTVDSVIYACIKQHLTVTAPVWALSTTKSVGDKVYPTVDNGFYYEVVRAIPAGSSGDTGLTEPTFPTIQGVVVTDNELVWEARADNKPGIGKDWESFWQVRGSTGGVWSNGKEFFTIGSFDLPAEVEDVLNVYCREDNNDLPINIITQPEYDRILDKGDEGLPVVAYFDRLIRNDTNSNARYRLLVYPLSDNINRSIHYDALISFNDMPSGTDTFQDTFNLPNRWLEALKYLLAVRLGEDFQIPASKLVRLERKAGELEREAMGKDNKQIGPRFIRGSYPV